jgi:outer membrane lipopolysaccharide assembly protein LptE/RlpB
MNKKILLFLTLVLLAGCGFTPMLKDFDMSKINVQKINYTGKNDLSYLVKSYLNIKETNSPNGLILNISISENISSAAKNSSGVTTEEDLSIVIGVNMSDAKGSNLLTDSNSAVRRLSVSNNLSSDEESRRIERNNLIRTLAQKIKFRLQLIAKQTQ